MLDFIKGLGIAALAVFAPIQAILLTVFIAMSTDLILGLLVARKKKVKISSSRLRDSVAKLLIYEIVIMIGYLAETYIGILDLPLAKLLGTAVIAVEFKSLLENAEILTGKKLFSDLIGMLKSKNDKS